MEEQALVNQSSHNVSEPQKPALASVLLKKLEYGMCIAGGLIMVAIGAWMTVETLLRASLSFSTSAVEEYSGYALTLCASWGFAYTLSKEGHIRIQVVTSRLPSRLQFYADILARLTLVGFAIVLAWRLSALTLTSWARHELSPTLLQTPLWIPELFMLLGFIVLAMDAVVRLGLAISAGGGVNMNLFRHGRRNR